MGKKSLTVFFNDVAREVGGLILPIYDPYRDGQVTVSRGSVRVETSFCRVSGSPETTSVKGIKEEVYLKDSEALKYTVFTLLMNVGEAKLEFTQRGDVWFNHEKLYNWAGPLRDVAQGFDKFIEELSTIGCKVTVARRTRDPSSRRGKRKGRKRRKRKLR